MEATLDRFGRVVIPKKVRDDLGLRAGDILVVEEGEAEIRLKPARDEAHMVREGSVLVFVGRATGPLEDAVERDREERIRKVMGRMKG